MKKLIPILIALVMLVSVSACNGGNAEVSPSVSPSEDVSPSASPENSPEPENSAEPEIETGDIAAAYEAYSAMQEAMTDIISMDLSIQTIQSGVEGLTSLKMLRNGDDVEMLMIVESAGQTLSTYYKDGWSYVDMAGSKVKVQATEEQVASMTQSVNTSYPEESIKAGSVEEVDGGTLITLLLDSSAVAGSAGDVTAEILVDANNMLVSMTTDDGVTQSVIDVNTINGDLTIAAPMDLDTYVDTTAASGQ